MVVLQMPTVRIQADLTIALATRIIMETANTVSTNVSFPSTSSPGSTWISTLPAAILKP